MNEEGINDSLAMEAKFLPLYAIGAIMISDASGKEGNENEYKEDATMLAAFFDPLKYKAVLFPYTEAGAELNTISRQQAVVKEMEVWTAAEIGEVTEFTKSLE